MSDNLKIWDALRRPPSEALKGFKRGGGFSGTAIKPMWSIQAMTEHFGPCGEGWGITKPKFETFNANNEILVFCTVSIWWNDLSNEVWGVGGDKILVSQSSGLRTDDEAFKKAYTDAITNALKYLGVGADIHMGLWDGSKYADEEAHENVTTIPTKAATRQEFQDLCRVMNLCSTPSELLEWAKASKSRIDQLNPDLITNLRASFDDKMTELKAKAA